MNEKEIMKILDNHEKRIKSLEDNIGNDNQAKIVKQEILNYEKLSSELNLEISTLESIYSIYNQKLTLLKITGKDEKEKTQNTTLLVIIGYDYLLNIAEVLSQDIRRNVAEHGLSLSRFATHINEISPKQIKRIGKPKSPKTRYKLTIPGREKAKELLLLIAGD